MFGRWAEPLWKRKLAAPYVHLVFGARQTGYVICRCPTPLALTDRVTALPWSHL